MGRPAWSPSDGLSSDAAGPSGFLCSVAVPPLRSGKKLMRSNRSSWTKKEVDLWSISLIRGMGQALSELHLPIFSSCPTSPLAGIPVSFLCVCVHDFSPGVFSLLMKHAPNKHVFD